MVTIRTVQNIKIGSRITFLNGIYAILLGIVYLVFARNILKINFSAIGSLWAFFDKFNPEIGSLFVRLFILVGLVIVATGAGITYLSHIISKKKEKDYWIVLLIMGVIFWTGLFIIEAMNKNVYTITASVIGWISFVIGMVIPIKYYFQKSYQDD